MPMIPNMGHRQTAQTQTRGLLKEPSGQRLRYLFQEIYQKSQNMTKSLQKHPFSIIRFCAIVRDGFAYCRSLHSFPYETLMCDH